MMGTQNTQLNPGFSVFTTAIVNDYGLQSIYNSYLVPCILHVERESKYEIK